MDDQKATVYLPAKVCCGKRPQHLRGYSVAIYGIIIGILSQLMWHIKCCGLLSQQTAVASAGHEYAS